MEDNKKNDRLSIIKNILLIAFTIIAIKILYMTTLKHEHYKELAENKTYKHIITKAPRGEIRDKYGRLIAGNKNRFTVQVSGDGMKKTDADGKSMMNDISLDLINILEKNGEEYIDEFPIYIENGKYYYTYDDNIREFKQNYGEESPIPQALDAEETFYYIVDQEISKGNLEQSDRNLPPVDLQKKLNDNNIYPPILVSKWMFTDEKNKQDWLASYGIDNVNISPKNAFKEIRNNEKYDIDKKLSDLDARKILIVRDLIKSQGYSQYNPVTIAKDISEKTIAQIEEKGMELLGVSVGQEPVRYYPDGELAFHMLGYMGKMPYGTEDKYLDKNSPENIINKYIEKHPSQKEEVEDKKYSKGDIVGVSGIEKYYEVPLKGEDGYKRVQVDALGRITKELDVVEPKSGDTIYLSIDKNLQMDTEKALEGVIKTVKSGGTYKSPFGDKTISKASVNLESGAVIAVDVKTGDLLSMASYPTFDPNRFVSGMSSKDYEEINPKNPNDVLAPSAQRNLVTYGAFQPGSVFKPITGMAAIDNGLSPNYAINDSGVVRLGNRPFADLIWHKSRSNHGYTDLYKAIQESCNVYFYTIGTGKNYSGGKDPGVKIGANDILDYAKKFGLNEESGLKEEIGEKGGKVPTIESKITGMQSLLRDFLDREMANDFTDINKKKDRKEYKERIEEISNWVWEKKVPGRVEVINRLVEMNVKEDRAEYLSDKIRFDYLNFAKWGTADTFNLSIGQGENQNTPAQMVRYTAAIANGGNLVELSVVDRLISSDYNSINLDENKVEKIDFNNSENLEHLREGMRRVAVDGTGKGVFGKFPVSVGVKTGTAEKSGKIPTENEVEYLEKNISSYGVSLEEARNLANTLKKQKEEEKTLDLELEIKEKLKDKNLNQEEKEALEKQLEDGVEFKYDKDDQKAKASFLREAIKELNPKITDEQIDRFKADYRPFSWSIGFAPYDNPEIAVVAMLPQGESGGNAALLVREVMGYYFELDHNKNDESTEENDDNGRTINKEDINFITNMKK